MAHTGRCSASTKHRGLCKCSCAGALHGIVVGARTQSLVPRAPVMDRPTPAGAPFTSLPPSAPAPAAWREILDAIIEWWQAGHGQVTDISGIPEKDLVHGLSVKELIVGELHGNAV